MKLCTTTGIIGNKKGYKEAVRMIAEAGFDAYDLNMCKAHVTPNELTSTDYMTYLVELKALQEALGIKCTQAHSPYPTYLNGNEEYNKSTLDVIIRSMECASFLGAEIIVVHPIKNSSSSMSGGVSFVPFRSREELWETNLEFFRGFIPYCEKYNIKIAVENMWERHRLHHDTLVPATLGYCEEHARFIDEINSSYIVACLDIGHALICGEKPQDGVRYLGTRLGALHIHDCNGHEDQHLLPYTMNSDWDEILTALSETKYSGDFTFETAFFNKYPEELYPDALALMCKMGRYMIREIENKA